MNIEALLSAMTPEVFERIQEAVETGKWGDGSRLSEGQRESCMQAVMLYQAKIAKSSEHMTVNEHGEIVHKSKQDFKRDIFSSTTESIARFKHNDI
ncbi:YeaC family protein [Alteromonas sp. ASW11-130]|uniref:YeaC family protein n=1 Tax=Alteromonas sp. ASW11-130 TaxID=3015775 RepID=UPI00224273FA|nr:DUF1315 family protein [Alteromonas sp. ASW11-130]MCW8092084.1 DUF1315 family protein [Alteromonas sp. ASW11-130]